ncbi:cysteine desulfurase family protein [Bacillus marinisedimentorum]|uniref:cysteine desulfurase family protein n=1 Tax=Bacillus marinisedimentorum TaxID=1821260 RepID=UPI0007E03E08|nr:cysteine desulfurase family protein [Bacillus marinisedimentorum]
MERIYLDHAATTPVHPEVVEAMLPFFTESFGNPSSIHSFGREARRLVDKARRTMASAIGAKEDEVIFTSGGTEADNLGILGAAQANSHKGNHIITTAIEHHAVLNTCKELEKRGFSVTYLPVDTNGIVSLQDLQEAVTDSTILVTVMYGNNEVGTMQPIREIGEFLEGTDVLFHTDAVQAFGYEEIDVDRLKVDLLSVSGHKINGPKGIGFLYKRTKASLAPALFGGEQEKKRRAGTENTTAIAGFQAAVKRLASNKENSAQTYGQFKKRMTDIFTEENIKFEINGSKHQVLPHIFNVYFPGIPLESMLVNLDLSGIAASSGSACTAGTVDPSHVLSAMFGKESEQAKASIRFSFGYGNTIEQIDKAARETAKIVKRLVK